MDIRSTTKSEFINIKVLTINVNGFFSKEESIKNLILENDVDVACFQETKATNLLQFKLPEYDVHHLSPVNIAEKVTPYHGTCIIIKKIFRAERISPLSSPKDVKIECFSRIISLKLPEFDMAVTTVYAPAVKTDLSPEQNMDRFEDCLGYLQAVLEAETNSIIAGDFNTDVIRDAGTPRAEYFDSCFKGRYYDIDKKYINESSYTFKSFQHADTHRYLDRIISSMDMSTLLDYKILTDQDIGSDHLPVLATFRVKRAVQPKPKQLTSELPRINWSKASEKHLTAYRETVNALIKKKIVSTGLYNNESLNTLGSILEEAARLHIPKIKIKNKTARASALWLEMVKPSQETFQQWSSLLSLTDKQSPAYEKTKYCVRKARLNMKLQAKLYKTAADQQKAARFEDKAKIYGAIEKPRVTLESPPKLLQGHSPENQLDMWYKHYRSTFQGKDQPKQLPPQVQVESKLILSELEVRSAIKLIDTKKAFTRHHHFKHLTDLGVSVFTKCLNTWLEGITTPEKMKVPWDFLASKIGPIPKGPDKSLAELKSYRPIALATTEAWLAEKICLKRCLSYFETADCQFGYKASHSTTHAISIAKELLKKPDVHVGLLDASAAFDRISHERIENELKRRKVPAELIRFILALTYHTHFFVSWFGDITTTPIYPRAGVKQGGCLSAYLFAITYDILAKMIKSTPAGVPIYGIFLQCLIFADDILLCAITSSGLRLLYEKVQEFCNLHEDISMNPSKSLVLRVGTRRQQPISICKIPTAKYGKYLGAYITQNDFKEIETRRLRQSLFGRYNQLLRHATTLRHLTDKSKRSIISAYGLPYGLCTIEETTSRIRAPHRYLTMHMFPQAYGIKDANGITIKSRTLYQIVAKTPSLEERHRILRNNFILSARSSSNHLIKIVVGQLQTI